MHTELAMDRASDTGGSVRTQTRTEGMRISNQRMEATRNPMSSVMKDCVTDRVSSRLMRNVGLRMMLLPADSAKANG